MHDLQLILGHRSLRIHGVISSARGLVAVAVTPEIRADDGEALGEDRCHAVPHRVRLRVAVQEEQGHSPATMGNVDPDAVHLDPLTGEPRQHATVVAEISFLARRGRAICVPRVTSLCFSRIAQAALSPLNRLPLVR